MKNKIKKLNPAAVTPAYAHRGDAGLDLHSLENKTLRASEHYIFFLGFSLEFPAGFAGIVMDKSGIAKVGLKVFG